VGFAHDLRALIADAVVNEPGDRCVSKILVLKRRHRRLCHKPPFLRPTRFSSCAAKSKVIGSQQNPPAKDRPKIADFAGKSRRYNLPAANYGHGLPPLPLAFPTKTVHGAE
jgi:hypothetical protein